MTRYAKCEDMQAERFRSCHVLSLAIMIILLVYEPMKSRHIELIIIVAAVVLAQWPLFVFANQVSLDEYAKSSGSMATAGAILGAYKLWKGVRHDG